MEKGPVRSCVAIDVVYTHINGSTGASQNKERPILYVVARKRHSPCSLQPSSRSLIDSLNGEEMSEHLLFIGDQQVSKKM
jgi:hypothetical protein